MAADTTVEIGPRPVPQEPMVGDTPLSLSFYGLIWAFVVYHYELGNVDELRQGRFGTFAVPCTDEGRLDSCLPRPGPDQLWLRPIGFPYTSIY